MTRATQVLLSRCAADEVRGQTPQLTTTTHNHAIRCNMRVVGGLYACDNIPRAIEQHLETYWAAMKRFDAEGCARRTSSGLHNTTTPPGAVISIYHNHWVRSRYFRMRQPSKRYSDVYRLSRGSFERGGYRRAGQQNHNNILQPYPSGNENGCRKDI